MRPATPQSQTHRSILHNDLAIKNGSPARQLARGSNNAEIAVTPIMTIAGAGESSAALDYQHGAAAVMLDLMNPVSALRRLVCEAWQLRRNEPELSYADHGSYLIPTRQGIASQ